MFLKNRRWKKKRKNNLDSKKNITDPEKQQFKKRFLIWAAFLASMYLYAILVRPPILIEITIRSLMLITTLLMSYLFGFYALGAAIVFTLIDNSINFHYWIKAGDPYNFSVIAMAFTNLLASLIIAYGVEKDKKQKTMLEQLSITDGMTGVYNHRYFKQKLEEELFLAERNNENLVLVMLDIDEFKEFNDLWGHTEGDMAIRITAGVLKNAVRKEDIICRYGGDEFSMIFPNSTEDEVVKIMERVKTAYKEQNLRLSDSDVSSPLTLSMGFSIFPSLAMNGGELITQADSALYHAKGLGRDRIEKYRDDFKDIQIKMQHNRELEDNLQDILQAISDKDKHIQVHSERVADYAVLIGRALDMTKEELFYLRIGALLHDIGNFKIPESVLNKQGMLTGEEYELIKQHSLYSANLVQSLSKLGSIVEDIKHHHERFDGKGYPDGVSNFEIPLGARILAVADAFDAMCSDRPYRKALSLEEALKELVDNAGTQFDPELVKVFINSWHKDPASTLSPNRSNLLP